MSSQEQKEFEDWMKTEDPASQEMAMVLFRDGYPLEEIRYYVDF